MLRSSEYPSDRLQLAFVHCSTSVPPTRLGGVSRATQPLEILPLLVRSSQHLCAFWLGGAESPARCLHLQPSFPILPVRNRSRKRWRKCFSPASFVFYVRLLLYLSLFGFTLEPRQHRDRFAPPRLFLQHLDFGSRLRTLHKQHMVNITISTSSEQSKTQTKDLPSPFNLGPLFPATTDEIRAEVDILLSDLIVRLKQLLFNSLLCADYAGFIPMQFTEVRVHGGSCVYVCCRHTALCIYRTTSTTIDGGVSN